jgi:hypothetical protein
MTALGKRLQILSERFIRDPCDHPKVVKCETFAVSERSQNLEMPRPTAWADVL